mgnify:CR=1 FL=1
METKLNRASIAIGRILLMLQRDFKLYKHELEKETDDAMQDFWIKRMNYQSYIISKVEEIGRAHV